METNELSKEWNKNGGDNKQYRPKDYVQIKYAPKKKVEDESQIGEHAVTKMENAYTLWIMINDTNQKRKKKDSFDQN